MAAMSVAQSGYRIGEDSSTADAGPVRMARFDYLNGHVDSRSSSSLGWSAATRNLPIRQGGQIWAPAGSRAEVQFDDGSDMRLANGAVATLTTMYSDSHGEFTEVKLSNGLATLHLVNKQSLYQIDTPVASIKAYGPADIRVGDTSGIEIACKSGEAVMTGKSGDVTLHTGEYLNLPNGNCPCNIAKMPAPDAWDKFNENRDQVVYRAPKYVPSNIGLVAGGLDNYGEWHDDTRYGHVWCPREHAGWQPYHDGRWVWDDPYGWTWVGNEDWGWAPYHYGTWVHESYGWGWCPGPAEQCWSPAVVSFCDYDNNVAWCPLAPDDVHYSAGVSLGIGGLLLSFSIGRAGCYYPVSGGYCEPRPWSNIFVNRVTNYYDPGAINTYYGGSGLNAYWGRNNFVPRNARFGGGTFVASNGFTRVGGFGRLASNRADVFRTGRSFGMPRGNGAQISGPLSVRPSRGSFTASRQFDPHGPSAAIMNRAVVRSAVPRYAARNSVGVGRTVAVTNRAGSFARGAAVGAGAVGAAALAHGAANRFAHGHQNTAASNAVRANMARPNAGRANMGRANTGAANANRYNRFNSISHSPFTRNSTKAAAGGAAAAALAHRNAAAHRNTATNAHRGSFGAAVNRTRANIANRAHNAATRVRQTFTRHTPTRPESFHRAGGPMPRATAHRSVSRPAVHRAAARPAAHRSFSRPATNHRSFSRPATAHRSFSRPSSPRPNMSRPSFSRPSRQNFSRPSAPRMSAPRQSAPRGGGGRGGGGGGGRRHGH